MTTLCNSVCTKDRERGRRDQAYLNFLRAGRARRRRGLINNPGAVAVAVAAPAALDRGRVEEKLILSHPPPSLHDMAGPEAGAGVRGWLSGETGMNWLGTFSSSISFSFHPLTSTEMDTAPTRHAHVHGTSSS